jgi:hypothetical protein
MTTNITSPSADNGWTIQGASYQPAVRIIELPVGSKVGCGCYAPWREFRVGKPELRDDGTVVCKWFDGQQWDWVEPDTTFKTFHVPSTKKISTVARVWLLADAEAKKLVEAGYGVDPDEIDLEDCVL